MDRTELIAWLEREEIRERETAERWRTAGQVGVSHVAQHTLRAERFAQCRRAIEAQAWRKAQS